MITQNNAALIIKNRELAILADSAKLKEKREKFLNFLMDKTWEGSNRKEKIPGMDSKYKTKGLGFDERIVYIDTYGFQVLEMYYVQDKVVKSEKVNPKPIIFNIPKIKLETNCKIDPLSIKFGIGESLNKNAVVKSESLKTITKRNWNTRTKIKSETSLEIDKLPFNKAVELICKTCLKLIKENYHFTVFLAKGARSPWIKIYDLDELKDLTPQQRIAAQIAFWRKFVPFGMFQYIDIGMFVDEHYQPLEFAPHWKYHTPFDLLFEWMPKCKN